LILATAEKEIEFSAVLRILGNFLPYRLNW
jgi:hypothetical protein